MCHKPTRDAILSQRGTSRIALSCISILVTAVTAAGQAPLKSDDLSLNKPLAAQDGGDVGIEPPALPAIVDADSISNTVPDSGGAVKFSTTDAKRRLGLLRESVEEARTTSDIRVRNIDDKVARLRRMMALAREQCRDVDRPDLAPKKQATLPPAPPTPAVVPNIEALPIPKPTLAEPTEQPKPEESLEKLIGNAVAISDKAVDQMGLANNLFATGEVALALRIYESVNLNELNAADQAWARYQMAGCHRRLGSNKEAESLYRIVAAAGESSPYCAQKSRWWLDTMSKTARLKQRHMGMVNSLVQLKEATNALAAGSN